MNFAKVKKLRDEQVKLVQFEYEGEQVEVKLSERELRTPGVISELQQAVEGKDAMGLARGLERVIKEWNLHLDGAPFPPTAENLGMCEVEFLGKIVNEGLGEKNEQSASA
ncbi:MAG TPA: hypothetical protein VFA21_20565 [Pyrinomonadaceae bacterium]|nr:hypothetical protein [Pyrinomonadaceae bacterium]